MTGIALCVSAQTNIGNLARLLDGLKALDCPEPLSIVIVDNHPSQASRTFCKSLADYPLPIACVSETRSGLAASRNTAIRRAQMDSPEFIVMLDDGKTPGDGWLAGLLDAQKATSADIVCGPVEPEFEKPMPSWDVLSHIFHRPGDPDSGNMMFRASLFRDMRYPWFDARYGDEHSDGLLIRHLIASGRRFAAAPKAVVRESIAAVDMTGAVLFRRAFQKGRAVTATARLVQGWKGRFLSLFGAAKVFGRSLIDLMGMVIQPWRLFSARLDLAEAAGRVAGLFSPVPHEYGEQAPGALAAPSTTSAITIACYDNWGDLEDALFHLTPDGACVWDGVAFVHRDTEAPDWIGIFNHPGRKAVRISAPPNRVFFASGEPPTPYQRGFNLGQSEGGYVLTTDADLCAAPPARRNYVLCPTMTRTWSVRRSLEELRATQVRDKLLKLSWITSDRWQSPGYQLRLAFLEKLRNGVPFDLYGRGYKPIPDKWDALAPYRYSIAFESAAAPHYFTEKIMDCFVAETMPIYYGSPRIAEYFPADSMFVIDPEDPDVIAKIKDLIESDLWLRRRDAIREAKALVLEKYNMFARLSAFVKSQNDVPLPPQSMIIERVTAKWG